MEQVQQRLDINQTTPVECEKCKGQVFKEVTLIRKVSRFITNTPQDTMIPIPVFACHKCDHVNDEFLPPQLRSDYIEIVE
jgi:DNA-directed RNA polymerase subunit M/transcription elongation factor TFIIS